MGGIQNINNRFLYPMQSIQGQRRKGVSDLDAAAASGAAFAAGAQRLLQPLNVQPPAATHGIQALGKNKPHGDEFARFLNDKATFQHSLERPKAAQGLGTRLDISL
jgi:hypothetical protein